MCSLLKSFYFPLPPSFLLYTNDNFQSLIFAIAHEAADTTGPETALTLLKLKEVLYSGSLTAASLREARRLIWKSDLIHLMVEVLRGDFSSTPGQWHTAAELARVLADVCAALKPVAKSTKKGGGPVDPHMEELVKEYFNFLLPAAADSLLVLANNIHECETSTDTQTASPSGSSSLVYLDQFSSTLDGLVWLCSTHKLCITHSLQSPYLLHLLILDNPSYSLIMLQALSRLTHAEPASLSSLPSHILQSLLDELVYKTSGSNRELAIAAAALLASFSQYHSPIMELICDRYKGLASILQRWGDRGFDTQTHDFIASLSRRAESTGKTDRLHRAAAIIQAGWRGYCTRRNLIKMHRGIRRFQQLYRQRKSVRLAKKQSEGFQQVVNLSLQTQERQKLRLKHETQLSLLEQLPASSVSKYLNEEQETAAIQLQSWWRGMRVRKKADELRELRKKERSARAIQAGMKRLLARRKGQKEANSNQECAQKSILRPPTKEERKQFQLEIIHFQETRPSQYRTDEQLAELNTQVLTSLQDFYASRPDQRQQEKQRALLLSQLESQSELLLKMPSLSQSTPETARAFRSRSRVVARMAERAHQEELRAMQLPWWKRLDTDLQEIPPLHD